LNILALETSTEFCSVALSLNGEILHKEILAKHQHSELLLPMIQKLLSEAELTLQQMDGIAFGAGPGSFTGLRIACGVAQGLAYAIDLPVVGVSTLEAIAQSIAKSNVIVALDARMGEIYHAAYQKLTAQDWQAISPPQLCSPRHPPALSDQEWHGCGNGFDIYEEELSMAYNKNIQQIHYGCHPHAKEIVHLALPRFTDGTATEPANAAPIYIRNKVALKENER
jgi:tRNA threonylcarbamoyladenosine biosynthesis protein TsaB